MKAVEYKIGGIKCDNPDCDFRDMDVKFEDYPLWLNRPCPKCGWNLLTQDDLDTTKTLLKLVNFINAITKPFTPFFKKSKRIKVKAEMDGTGKVDFKKIEGD